MESSLIDSYRDHPLLSTHVDVILSFTFGEFSGTTWWQYVFPIDDIFIYILTRRIVLVRSIVFIIRGK
jgi:hypothetical protein